MPNGIDNPDNQEYRGPETAYLDPQTEAKTNEIFGDRRPLPGFRVGPMIAQPIKQSEGRVAVEVVIDGHVVTVLAALSAEYKLRQLTVSVAEGDKEPECILDKPVA